MFAMQEKGPVPNKLRGVFAVVIGVDLAVCLLLLATVSFGSLPGGTIRSADHYGTAATLR